MQIKKPDSGNGLAGIDSGPIVVAIDSSGSSRHALEEAIRISVNTGEQIYAVNHIYDEEMETFCRWLPNQQEALLAGRKARLIRWLEDLDFVTDKVNIRVSVGHAFAELLALVDDLEPGMLVVGMHGDGTYATKYFAKACLGSGKTDVLFVRDCGSGPFQNIVVGIDFSASSRRAMVKAASLALIEGCPLHVIHIFSPDWEHFGDRKFLKENVADHLAKLVDRFDEWIEQDLANLADLNVTFEIRQEVDPHEGIISYASEIGADLIVVGLVGRGHTHYRYPGSTVERILGSTDCSVLATRAVDSSK